MLQLSVDAFRDYLTNADITSYFNVQVCCCSFVFSILHHIPFWLKTLYMIPLDRTVLLGLLLGVFSVLFCQQCVHHLYAYCDWIGGNLFGLQVVLFHQSPPTAWMNYYSLNNSFYVNCYPNHSPHSFDERSICIFNMAIFNLILPSLVLSLAFQLMCCLPAFSWTWFVDIFSDLPMPVTKRIKFMQPYSVLKRIVNVWKILLLVVM